MSSAPTRITGLLALLISVAGSVGACSKRARSAATESCDPGGAARWAKTDPRPRAKGPSPGCAQPRVLTGAQRRSMTVAGQQRSFLVVPPHALDPKEAAPLIFVWHGLGSSGERVRTRFGLEVPAKGRAFFVYPDALPHPDFKAAGWDFRSDGPDFQFFDAMLEELADQSCIDLGRVFATGHSFGGWMTNRLGFARGSRLRGIAPSAGGLARRDCAGRPLPVWIAHASNDDVVAFEEGQAAHTMWLKAAGCAGATQPVSPSPCVAQQGCAADVPVHFCVHRQHHAWPDFAAAGIWNFFSQLR